MSQLNSFLEKQVRTYTRKRKTRSDKKITVHVWLDDEQYRKIFEVSKKNRKTMTQYCTDIVVHELQHTDVFSLIQHRVHYKQVNIRLTQEFYEQVVDLASSWGCIPIRHATNRILISGLRSAGVL